jgi:antagonist of KipI
MSLRIVLPGLLTTVQDLGREGSRQWGVPVGGAMDRVALRVANLLVGNEEQAAGLEFALLGPTIEFTADHNIALCGEFEAAIDSVPLPTWRPVRMKSGAVLRCGRAARGCRGYLAIGGGIDVPLLLNSRSTYLSGHFGGFHGRALATDDLLPVGSNAASERVEPSPAVVTWSAALGRAGDREPIVRAIRGPQFDWLDEASRQRFWHEPFRVTPQSDRMGYRLASPPLRFAFQRELLSAAVSFGDVQLPGGGEPIVLMADCATTGGYPRLAHVIEVDLSVLAQLPPGSSVRWQEATIEEAHALLRRREAEFARLRAGLRLKGIGR